MGVWIETSYHGEYHYPASVTPCMGVWIETRVTVCSFGQLKSHPVWVCGLKLQLPHLSHLLKCVTPCMGVWIETGHREQHCLLAHVTPCMGVWIETGSPRIYCQTPPSHPVWVCGLKLYIEGYGSCHYSSHPVWVCGLKPCGKYG